MIGTVRVLVQRVGSAQVTVDGEVVGLIDPAAHGAPQGLVALVGVTHSDTEATAKAMADKLFRLRILEGERSAADLGAPILVVSQFTLYADTAKGRRPSWSAAAPGRWRSRWWMRSRRRCGNSGRRWRPGGSGRICRSNWSMMVR